MVCCFTGHRNFSFGHNAEKKQSDLLLRLETAVDNVIKNRSFAFYLQKCGRSGYLGGRNRTEKEVPAPGYIS